MPVFNIASSLGKKSSASQDYGILVDQLDILEKQLSSDGKLSPGDYKLLKDKAQQVYSHPGLTPAQRSNVEVKIAGYDKDATLDLRKDSEDIDRLNREYKDDVKKIGLMFSSDPAKFLQAQQAAQAAKIQQLSTAIDDLESAGDDTSAHYNEFNEALTEYNETQQALEDVDNYDGTGTPQSNFVTYITTNSDGEIVDLKVGRIGSQTGYLETNGLYGGLPVYGKVNRKEYGKNIFTLGGQTFSAADTVIPGPDGTMKPSQLIETSGQQVAGGGFSVAKSGYVDVDLTNVRSQSAVRVGGWIQGDKGFLYQRQEDGSYKKYVNYTKEQLGIEDNDIVDVPSSFEKGIISSVRETADALDTSVLPPSSDLPDMGAAASSTVSAQAYPSNPTSTTTAPVGTKNTGGAPTDRSPQNAQGLASRVVGAAKGFLGRVFGGQ